MEQLKEMLREVLQEELSPRLDRLEHRMDNLEKRMDSVEDRLNSMEGQMASIKNQLDRMEQSQPEDIVGMLPLIDKKIITRTDRHEHQISVLNDRLLAVEADVHKLQST